MSCLAAEQDLCFDALVSASKMRDRLGILSLYTGPLPAASCIEGFIGMYLDDRASRFIMSADVAYLQELDTVVSSVDHSSGSTSAQGRVAFQTGEGKERIVVPTKAPIRPVATLRPRAFLLPCLSAMEHQARAGMVAVGSGRATVVESEDGYPNWVIGRTVPSWSADSREGDEVPAGGAWSIGQHGVGSDWLSDGLGTCAYGSCRRLASAVHDLARESGWQAAVISGSAALASTLEEELQALGTPAIVSTEATEPRPDSTAMAQDAHRACAALRARQHKELVSELLDEALPEGTAAVGVAESLKAIASRRASVLIFSCHVCGGVGGMLDEELERMVEFALEDELEIQPVCGAASDRLSRHGGVAVRLDRPWAPLPRMNLSLREPDGNLRD